MATTTGALCQDAVNILVPLQQNLLSGTYQVTEKEIADVIGAVLCLVEAYYATLGATAASTTTSVSPASITIGTQYSATQSLTAAIQTTQR